VNPWVSHLATFIGGVLAGAMGDFFATRLTDSRRRREVEKERQRTLRELTTLMPDLMEEMKEDFRNPEHAEVREFAILPSENVIFSSQQKRFIYYENAYDNLRGKIAVLENHGLVLDVTPGNTPIYRVTEEFRELLRGK